MHPAAARPARRINDPSPDTTVARKQGSPRCVPGAPPIPTEKRSPLAVLPKGYRSPRARRRRRRAQVAAGTVAGLTGVFGLVLVHVQLTTNQLRLVRVQHAADAQQERYMKLRLQVAQLESPERVVATAQQLGMVPPATITYLTAAAGPGAAPSNPQSSNPPSVTPQPVNAQPFSASPSRGASSGSISGAEVSQSWIATKLNDIRR